jgi:hypothetical protein
MNLPVDQLVPFGSIRYLTAVAGPESVFAGWSDGFGNGGLHCTGTDRCAVDPTLGITALIARFNPKPSLTINLDVGPGRDPYGVASAYLCRAPSCRYAMDPFQTLTIVPSADNLTTTGWIFTGWKGDCAGTATCALTMNGDRTLTGVFRRAPALVVTKLVNGTVSVPSAGLSCDPASSPCSLELPAGNHVDLLATPLPPGPPGTSHVFVKWTGDAASCGTNAHCSLTIGPLTTVSPVFSTVTGPP